MNRFLSIIIVFLSLTLQLFSQVDSTKLYIDNYRRSVPFAKSPTVIKFEDMFLMYYAIPPAVEGNNVRSLWGIGIAQSEDLNTWQKIGEVVPDKYYERTKGIASPEAFVRDGVVHLFYQTMGRAIEDAICHAKSSDGIVFERNNSNPIIAKQGDWNSGRASEPCFVQINYRNWMYFTTYCKQKKKQFIGVVSAPYPSHFVKEDWALMSIDTCVIGPEYPWEGNSIEAVSVIEVDEVLYMFYSGAFPNRPQQIGVAKSTDGIHFTAIKNRPFLSSGDIGEWNYSEVGHPKVFKDKDKYYLFFHGNRRDGESSYISKVEIGFDKDGPFIINP